MLSAMTELKYGINFRLAGSRTIMVCLKFVQ